MPQEAVGIKRIQQLYITLLVGFLLGIHDGYITLWRDGDPNPAQVFPYKAEYLPNADRKALENGIHIGSEEELQQLLEDYLS